MFRCFIDHPYNLERVIGKGSHGIVYAACRRTDQKQVAIKDVKDTHKTQAEAAMLQYVESCPHIVKYHEDFEADGRRLIVMDYFEGSMNGAEYMRCLDHPVDEARLQQVAQPLVATLDYLHTRYIMYGDMKPENVLFLPDGSVKIMDMGCSRNLQEYADAYPHIMGTPQYFAPEKFGFLSSRSSDVWSLGVLMYWMICNHHPFVHHHNDVKCLADLEVQICNTDISFAHPAWDHTSSALKDLLSKMLQKDYRKRLNIWEVSAHRWWSI